MDLEAVGAYIMLLASAWDNDPVGTLPDDNDKLRKLAGASEEQWRRIAFDVMSNFEPFNDGLLQNVRLRQQYEELASYKEMTHDRAKAGAKARWVKKKDASSMPQAMPEPCLAMPLHSASATASATATSTSIAESRFDSNARSTASSNGTGDSIRLAIDQIISHYPMKANSDSIRKKWRTAIELEIESIKTIESISREEAADLLFRRVRAYASTNPVKVWTLDKFVADGHYDMEFIKKAEQNLMPEFGPASFDDGETFKVEDIDDSDGLR